MSYLLGLDVGTTGVRCIALDGKGAVRAASSVEHPSHSPRLGWSEQQPEDWWRGAQIAIAQVTSKVGDKVVGIGVTGQMHGAVFLDRSERVIRPALLWNDQRTTAQCEAITQRVGAQRLIDIAGNPALTGFQAPKILWLRDEEPEAYSQLEAVLLPKDYLRLKLTGDKATDASDASGTLLLDLRRRAWSQPILDSLEIPTAWLPRVFEGPEVTGTVRAELAKELGLAPGVVVAAGAGDNAAAAIGNGIVSEGLMSCSIGSSGVLFAHTDELAVDSSGRLHAFCHAVPNRYHLMGVTLSAGASLRWWRDLVNHGGYDELGELALQAPPGAEGLVFLPYLSGERTPHLDPRARGAFFGLTSRHGLGHLTRAVMEGVAFSLRDSLEIMAGMGVKPREIRATGGGARSALWRQILADVLGCPIVRTQSEEGPAYGAALLAGVAAGVFSDIAQPITIRPDVTEPDPSAVRRYGDYYAAYRSLYESTALTMHALSDLAEG